MTALSHLGNQIVNGDVMAAPWGTPVERERKRRIDLSVATYAYEIADRPIMSDAAWDEMAQGLNKFLMTGHPLLDEFFLVEFSPMTGLWIHKHPELAKVRHIFEWFGDTLQRVYRKR